MRLVCISDTHSLHEQLPSLPGGDVLIHAGDFTGNGKLVRGFEFIEWFGVQEHAHKILIAGNHDFCAEDRPFSSWIREHCEKHKIIYLEDTSVVIDQVKFHGCPWTPEYRNMAFGGTPKVMSEKMQLVPDDVHVLITHGPPRRLFDYVPADDKHVGCLSIAGRLPFLKQLKVHIFGHIHEGYGIRKKEGVISANVSTCTEKYKPTNPPVIIDL